MFTRLTMLVPIQYSTGLRPVFLIEASSGSACHLEWRRPDAPFSDMAVGTYFPGASGAAVTFPKDIVQTVTVNGISYTYHEWQYSANSADWYEAIAYCNNGGGVHTQSAALRFLWTPTGAVPH